ncbi:hypothetical protein THAR02_01556 [Trichoderma harzianum]|uniref:Uncharacterized protein n=1 Tax=Trichoderma harzianum TaxID=5544 RepID=A0A0F9XNK1_TRIHA|nr:hypothetical protein THAR02_01556 [Trichoderma harzianum]
MWVVLVIEMLNRAYDEGQLEAMHQRLQEVPSDLDEVFFKLLSEDNETKQETLFMLQFTRQLLKSEELYFTALAEMNVHMGPWDPAQITPDDIRRRITHSSRGLIEVRQGGNVQFIHELMRALLEKEIDFDAHGGLFGTALQAAASQDHSEAIVILLEAKASVNLTQGGVAGTALIAAATGGNPDVITMLLKEGANINAHGGVWGTALQAAAAIGNQAAVECLLEEGADINAQGGLYGTALQAAAAKGKKDIVEVLLTGGANIKIQAGAYGTALRAAVSEGHEMIATMLLKEGKKFNKQENISPTALDTVIDIIGKAIADIRAADDTSTQMKIYADNTYAELLLEEVGYNY